MKTKRIIPFLAMCLLVLSIGASAASKQTITFQGITMDIPSSWKASSSNDEKHATYEKGDKRLHFMDVFDLRRYDDSLEKAGAKFKEYTEDDVTYVDVSDPVLGKIDGKLDMHTIDCTYHAKLISVFGSGESNKPCKHIRVYLGGHDVVIDFVSEKGDFKDFDEAIATARYDEALIQKETEFDKETAKSEILELFQPYIDTINNMKEEVIAKIESDEDTMALIAEYQIDKEKLAENYSGVIHAKVIAVSASQNFGKISYSITYPDFDMLEEKFSQFIETYISENSVNLTTEEEAVVLVRGLMIDFLADPSFPVKSETFIESYFNGGDGWKLQDSEEIEEFVEALKRVAVSFIYT